MAASFAAWVLGSSPRMTNAGRLAANLRTLAIGGNAHPFVILGLDPRTHAVTVTHRGGAETWFAAPAAAIAYACFNKWDSDEEAPELLMQFLEFGSATSSTCSRRGHVARVRISSTIVLTAGRSGYGLRRMLRECSGVTGIVASLHVERRLEFGRNELSVVVDDLVQARVYEVEQLRSRFSCTSCHFSGEGAET